MPMAGAQKELLCTTWHLRCAISPATIEVYFLPCHDVPSPLYRPGGRMSLVRRLQLALAAILLALLAGAALAPLR